MTKIEIWDIEAQQFKLEEFVVNSDNFMTSASAYCKHMSTVIEKKIDNAIILSNRTILNLSKISKFKTQNLTKIGV